MKDNTYPKVDKPVDSRDAVEKLEAISEAAQVAGITLPAAISDGASLIERCQTWKSEAREMVEDRQAATRRITRALVDGDVDLDGALAEAARAEAALAGGIFSRAVAATEGVAARRAFAEIGEEIDGEAILTEARGVCEQAVKDIHKLRGQLDGITTDAEAAQAGPKRAAGWSCYTTEILPQFKSAHRLVELLRLQHWVEPLPIGMSARPYARPDLVLEDRRHAKRAGSPWLPILDVADDAAQPGGPFRAEELRAFNAQAAEAEHKRTAVEEHVAEGLLRVPGVQR